MIKKLLNNTSTIIYKDNDTIKKTRINGNTLLANYIIENINYVKDNTCLVTKEIYIFYNWILRNSEGKPIKRYNKSKYKKDHKKDHDDYTFLSEDVNNKLDKNFLTITNLLIKKFSQKCNKYIYIPIVLYPDPLYRPQGGKILHANGLLINIATYPPSWIRIEPQTPNYSQDLDLNRTFEQIVLDITGANRCIHLQLKETCPPQHITQDSNCMFWSLLTLYKICDLIIHDKDPIELEYVYNEQLLENLQEKMNDWKHYLVNSIIPACLDKYHFIWPIFNELFTKNDDIHKLNQIRSLVNLPAISWFFEESETNINISDEKRKILESFEKMHGIRGGHKILLNYYNRYYKK